MKRKKGEEPAFSKPVAEMTDAELLENVNGVISFFHERAKLDRCAGDLFTGWDWVTMRAVHTELCQKYDEGLAECKRRLETNDGVLNTVKYIFDGKQWRVR